MSEPDIFDVIGTDRVQKWYTCEQCGLEVVVARVDTKPDLLIPGYTLYTVRAEVYAKDPNLHASPFECSGFMRDNKDGTYSYLWGSGKTMTRRLCPILDEIIPDG